MPFQEVTRMHSRKQMIVAIQQGQSVAQAARAAGVSRPTAYHWLRQAQTQGLEHLHEGSRRPYTCPRTIPQSWVEPLLQAKATHPGWGAKKLLAYLAAKGQALPFCTRTAHRLLARHGLTQPRGSAPAAAPTRFVQERPNALWQLDFKSLGKPSLGYWPLSVLDDHSRFALAFEPLPRQDGEAVFGLLWRLFAEYGLPERMLSDNGSCFAGTWTQHGPSRLEVKLWLLGIATTHGRPYHPQTQGKVERFHRTMGEEASSRGLSLRAADVPRARAVYAPLRELYNWVRPHEELEMQVPGAVYAPSLRLRPERLPVHEMPATAIKRKVWPNGCVSWRGQVVRVGKGLAGEWVQVQEAEHEDVEDVFVFAGVPVARWPAPKLPIKLPMR